MTSAQRNENRLTDIDRAAITKRLREVIAGYGRDYRANMVDALAHNRIAWHAIGCDASDLRDSELDEIADIVLTELGFLP